MNEAVWHATVFTKNRDRLLEGEIAREFVEQVLRQARRRHLLSSEHFTVDGTMIEAWAGQKSFQPKKVVDCEIVLDGAPKFPNAPVGPATDLILGQRCKPKLHKVDPGRAGWGEMYMEPWSFCQPSPDGVCLVCAIVVQNQMDVQ